MGPHTLHQEEVKQILYDAGCSDGFTLEFLKTENATAQFQLLHRQRRCQLERVHSEEKNWTFWIFSGISASDAGSANAIIIDANEAGASAEAYTKYADYEPVLAAPVDYDQTVEVGEGQDIDGYHPRLISHVEQMEQYDTVYLAYPIWHYTLSVPTCSFLDEYDYRHSGG